MKYIRTKNKILIFRDYEHIDCVFTNIGWIYKFEIIKQADTIEELIMPGDLVRYDGLYMSWIEKDRGNKVRGIDMHLISRKSVDMLWIPTGNDIECYLNFKLAASKEDDKGEWELI